MGKKEKVQYQLRLSRKRKTIAVRVVWDGSIIVHAPVWVREKDIRQFIEKKQSWIRKQREWFAWIYRQAIYRTYEDGETFYIKGDQYTLKTDTEQRKCCSLDEDLQQIRIGYGVTRERRKQRIIELYRSIGTAYVKKRIPELLGYIEEITGERKNPSQVTVRNMKRRWGGCSSSGKITLSLRLFGAPVHLIDYVIIHEMIHLQEMNHQKHFYKLLTAADPEWKKKKKMLEELSGTLQL